MKYFILIFLFSGCMSLKQLAPTIGGGVGAGVGSVVGNPVGGAMIGGSMGAGAGQLIHAINENAEVKAKVKMLTEGDVQALVDHKVETSGIKNFMQTIKNWMIGGVVFLGFYLLIPIFLAKKCSQTEAKKHFTRPPIPRP